jgi:hypothetical protein
VHVWLSTERGDNTTLCEGLGLVHLTLISDLHAHNTTISPHCDNHKHSLPSNKHAACIHETCGQHSAAGESQGHAVAIDCNTQARVHSQCLVLPLPYHLPVCCARLA